MSKAIFHPEPVSTKKAGAPVSSFNLTAPQVSLLVALNKQAHVIDGELRKDGHYELRLSNLSEDSWVKLVLRHPELKSDNHLSRVKFFTMQFNLEWPAIVLPPDLHLPSPLPAALLPLLETFNPIIQSSGVCAVLCHENGELSLSYLTGPL